MVRCPFCDSNDYSSNGVDGFICTECSSEFFVRKTIPPEGLADNEVYDPGTDEIACPKCGSMVFEDTDDFDGQITCLCGHHFYPAAEADDAGA